MFSVEDEAAEFLGSVQERPCKTGARERSGGPRYLKYGSSRTSSVRYLRSDLEAFRTASTVDPGEARPA